MTWCSAAEAWETFFDGLTDQRQLDRIVGELTALLDSSSETSSDICCEYIMFLHGTVLPMPEMDGE